MDRTKQEELGAIVTRFDMAEGVLRTIKEYLSESRPQLDKINIPLAKFCIEGNRLTFPFLGNRVVVKLEIGKDSEEKNVAVLVWRIYDTVTEKYKDESIVHVAKEFLSLERPKARLLEQENIRKLCVEKLFDLTDKNAKVLTK